MGSRREGDLNRKVGETLSGFQLWVQAIGSESFGLGLLVEGALGQSRSLVLFPHTGRVWAHQGLRPHTFEAYSWKQGPLLGFILFGLRPLSPGLPHGDREQHRF